MDTNETQKDYSCQAFPSVEEIEKCFIFMDTDGDGLLVTQDVSAALWMLHFLSDEDLIDEWSVAQQMVLQKNQEKIPHPRAKHSLQDFVGYVKRAHTEAPLLKQNIDEHLQLLDFFNVSKGERLIEAIMENLKLSREQATFVLSTLMPDCEADNYSFDKLKHWLKQTTTKTPMDTLTAEPGLE